MGVNKTLKHGNVSIFPITYAHNVYKADGVTTVSADLASLWTQYNNLSTQNSLKTQQITDLQNLMPTQASSSNKLADKNFVNSSIATNTANFIGKFASVPALNEYSGTITKNDYAFVTNRVLPSDYSSIETLNAYTKSNLTHFDYAYVINGSKFDLYRFNMDNNTWELQQSNINKVAASTLNTAYNRYKYNGTAWLFEYSLNNSSYTAAQWAAINSGITASLVDQIGTNAADILTKAADNSVVHLAGSETITGAKTFIGDIKFKFNNDSSQFLTFHPDGNGYNIKMIWNGYQTLMLSGAYLYTLNVRPNTSATYDLGQSNAYYRDLYLSRNLSDGTNSISIEKIENKDNKVTSISNESTDNQYPSAKCVYDKLQLKQNLLTSILGYDATKIQTLKSIQGVLAWVDDEEQVSEEE